MRTILALAILVGLVIGPIYWIYGKFYSGRTAQTLTLKESREGKFVSGEFRVTPDMAPTGVVLTATGSFAPNMPEDQPPKVGYAATLFKDGTQFNIAKFPLKASSTSETNPVFKERLFYLEAPQDGLFRMELEAMTPQTIKLDSVQIEVKANVQEADGRVVSVGMVLMIVAVLGLLI
ncbi:MAG: hypothetical protein IPG66_18850 [Hydrogenophilales bacterium]|nr:hypothetical protein [Hydrogenophilales bacterium]